jgi:hypothetical protein
MAATAIIKFVQGLSTPPAGEALIGVLTTPVVASNANDLGISTWEWKIVDVPPGSSVATGVVSSAPTTTIIPDVRGGYLFQLTTTDSAGNRAIDKRTFEVAEASGRIIPPFSAEAGALNFGGQTRGWSKYMEEWLHQIDTSAASSGGDILVKSVATTNQALTGLPTIDQVSHTAGQKTLLTGQTIATENGVYAVAAGAWSRVNLLAGNSAAGVRVFVDQGNFWSKTRWECITNSGADVVGTNSLAWRRNFTLLDDIGYDVNDLACYLTDETGALSTVSNSVPGAPAYPLTAHFNGANLSFFTTEVNVGPFGGMSLRMLEGRGLYGANAAFDAPATCHVSAFFMPAMVTQLFGGGNRRSMFGRTRVATPTAFDATNVTLAFSGNLSGTFTYGDGSLADYYRRILVDATAGGVLSTIDASRTSLGSQSTISPNVWSQLDFIYNTAASSKLRAYVNGNQIALNESPLAGTPLNGTGNGYWFIGNVFANIAAFGAMPGCYSRVRIMNADRGQSWVQERYRRMCAWVGT